MASQWTRWCEVATLQTRKHPVEEKKKIHIEHSRGDHWIVAPSIDAAGNEVLVYDSVCQAVDRATNSIFVNFFPTSTSAELVEIWQTNTNITRIVNHMPR